MKIQATSTTLTQFSEFALLCLDKLEAPQPRCLLSRQEKDRITEARIRGIRRFPRIYTPVFWVSLQP